MAARHAQDAVIHTLCCIAAGLDSVVQAATWLCALAGKQTSWTSPPTLTRLAGRQQQLAQCCELPHRAPMRPLQVSTCQRRPRLPPALCWTCRRTQARPRSCWSACSAGRPTQGPSMARLSWRGRKAGLQHKRWRSGGLLLHWRQALSQGRPSRQWQARRGPLRAGQDGRWRGRSAAALRCSRCTRATTMSQSARRRLGRALPGAVALLRAPPVQARFAAVALCILRGLMCLFSPTCLQAHAASGCTLCFEGAGSRLSKLAL